MDSAARTKASSRPPTRTALFLALAAPFFANDFINIFIKSYALWLALDFLAAKAVPLGLLFFFMKKGWMVREDTGLAGIKAGPLAAWTALLALAGLGLDQFAWPYARNALPDTSLGAIPLDTESPLYLLDLTAGLVLVALVEEVVFRGAALAACRERGYGPAAAILASSVVFGLIHWSTGLHAVAVTGAIGAVFMAGTIAAGSVFPAVIAHFLINFASFSGLFASTVD